MFYQDLIYLYLHCNLPLMFPISIVLLNEVIIAFLFFFAQLRGQIVTYHLAWIMWLQLNALQPVVKDIQT